MCVVKTVSAGYLHHAEMQISKQKDRNVIQEQHDVSGCALGSKETETAAWVQTNTDWMDVSKDRIYAYLCASQTGNKSDQVFTTYCVNGVCNSSCQYWERDADQSVDTHNYVCQDSVNGWWCGQVDTW